MLIQTSRQTSITYSNLCSENISDQGKLLLMWIRLFPFEKGKMGIYMYNRTEFPSSYLSFANEKIKYINV